MDHYNFVLYQSNHKVSHKAYMILGIEFIQMALTSSENRLSQYISTGFKAVTTKFSTIWSNHTSKIKYNSLKINKIDSIDHFVALQHYLVENDLLDNTIKEITITNPLFEFKVKPKRHKEKICGFTIYYEEQYEKIVYAILTQESV